MISNSIKFSNVFLESDSTLILIENESIVFIISNWILEKKYHAYFF
jgi:hypothetical protein